MQSAMEPVLGRVAVAHGSDPGAARRAARQAALLVGLDEQAVEEIALATAELATNLARYARGGEIVLSLAESHRGRGLQVESRDDGPGISDVALAMEDGYSTGGGLGGGLPAVRRLMDELSIHSGPSGTSIVAIKWLTTR